MSDNQSRMCAERLNIEKQSTIFIVAGVFQHFGLVFGYVSQIPVIQYNFDAIAHAGAPLGVK